MAGRITRRRSSQAGVDLNSEGRPGSMPCKSGRTGERRARGVRGSGQLRARRPDVAPRSESRPPPAADRVMRRTLDPGGISSSSREAHGAASSTSSSPPRSTSWIRRGAPGVGLAYDLEVSDRRSPGRLGGGCGGGVDGHRHPCMSGRIRDRRRGGGSRRGELRQRAPRVARYLARSSEQRVWLAVTDLR